MIVDGYIETTSGPNGEYVHVLYEVTVSRGTSYDSVNPPYFYDRTEIEIIHVLIDDGIGGFNETEDYDEEWIKSTIAEKIF